MTFAQLKTQALRLFYSFIGAVAGAAALAALNWVGAHIPTAIQFIGSLVTAHAAQSASGN
ncbi:MAG: hypothetical protein KGH79_04265 [Patescibacteria group bacterium]|nr:hypothetical protein [Patescibacteria group bacterium]